MTNKLHAGTWLLALAACAVLASGSVAQAEIIHYANPAHGEDGHFHWAGTGGALNYLEMTLGPTGQPGASDSASTLGHAVDDASGLGTIGGNVWNCVGGFSDLFAVGVDYGAMITGTGSWAHSGLTYFADLGGSELPEGVQTYLPVAFDPFGDPATSCTIGGPDCHFGWVGVIRTGMELETFAWAYETEANVPIEAGAVPEPGTLAMLAMGAAALIRRRRA